MVRSVKGVMVVRAVRVMAWYHIIPFMFKMWICTVVFRFIYPYSHLTVSLSFAFLIFLCCIMFIVMNPKL